MKRLANQDGAITADDIKEGLPSVSKLRVSMSEERGHLVSYSVLDKPRWLRIWKKDDAVERLQKLVAKVSAQDLEKMDKEADAERRGGATSVGGAYGIRIYVNPNDGWEEIDDFGVDDDARADQDSRASSHLHYA